MKLLSYYLLLTLTFSGCEVRPMPATLGTPYDSATFEQARRRIDSLNRADSLLRKE